MILTQQLASALLTGHPAAAALALERMPVTRRAAVVRAFPRQAAGALEEMLPSAVAECLAELPAESASIPLEHMTLDHAVATLRRLTGPATDRILASLPADRQEALRRALRYPEGTAAALMDPAVLALPDDISVGEARVRLRRQPQGLLHYVFIVDRARMLVGVLDLPELMRARARDPLRSVMHEQVQHLPGWMPAAAVRNHPGWRSFHAMPVTDGAGRLLGAIRYQMLKRLEQDAARTAGPVSSTITAVALGELFQVGMAGLVEAVAAAAAGRDGRAASRGTTAGAAAE